MKKVFVAVLFLMLGDNFLFAADVRDFAPAVGREIDAAFQKIAQDYEMMRARTDGEFNTAEFEQMVRTIADQKTHQLMNKVHAVEAALSVHANEMSTDSEDSESDVRQSGKRLVKRVRRESGFDRTPGTMLGLA